LDEVASEHHVSSIKPVKIDSGNGPDEYRGKKNSRDSDSYLERIACKLENVPDRRYIEDEIARLGN